MNDFDREVLNRLPLAEAVWLTLGHVLEDDFLSELFEQNRKTGWEGGVRFSLLTQLILEALLKYQGSGRQAFEEARKQERIENTNQAIYGKLRRIPMALSQSLLRQATIRLRALLPEGADAAVPPALAGFRILMVDGKKLKRLPKRLKALRAVKGKMLGGKILAGFLLQEGIVVAMNASLDGEANDAPLTPGLLDQMEQQEMLQDDPRPLLLVADRQFCDLKIPHRVLKEDHSFLIRYSKKMNFYVEREQISTDAQGREIREAWGYLGSPSHKKRMQVRQITLVRPSEEDVILVTNLADEQQYPAEQLLALYLDRWEIERVFQKVTEVFHLEKFIGSTPQAAVFQFVLCTLLYNIIELVRRYIAVAQKRPARTLSSEMIFRDTHDQMTAAALLLETETVEKLSLRQSVELVRARLAELLEKPWSELWVKTYNRKPRKPVVQRAVPGNHSSAYKILQAHRASLDTC